MPQAQAVVGRHVSRAKAGAAEAGLDQRAAGEQVRRGSDPGQFQADGHAGGIHVQGEVAAAGGAAPEDGRRLVDVVKETAGAAGDDALIGPHAAVPDLLGQMGVGLGEAGPGVGLHPGQDVRGVCLELMDGPGVGGVEGQGDHGLHPAEVDFDVLIIPGPGAGMELLVVL